MGVGSSIISNRKTCVFGRSANNIYSAELMRSALCQFHGVVCAGITFVNIMILCLV